MKPTVIIYLLFSLFVLVLSWEEQNAKAVATLHQEVSAEEAIRLRILGNSDAIGDQAVKRAIRDQVNQAISEWAVELDSVEEAKDVISSNLSAIEEIVAEELEKAGLKQSYQVEFTEVQFPTKLYGNLVYPAGVYDAVLITLGEGKGENWWCVLFPPLCFLEMANGEAVETGQETGSESEQEEEAEDEVEVAFFVVELFSNLVDRIFSSEQA
ncbi:stage II sporulation protein R [Halalkalibacter oceani]|uniref:Stage II sporulation protein R n=1 Tax=Halalkalibacter oceani TaxID=1653776 RepID=A0A9X2DR98_9BACI|nr:stage II sporulation protein R [Halalkalibacter oceani]MCM3714265.1 stage II sporulation protein R [Halalkalibacter oceani]